MKKRATASPHRIALEQLGLGVPFVARLERYLDAVAAWSARVNVTGARTVEERVQRLVVPVLPSLALVTAGTLLDVGSGNGSPGLVLALLRDDIHVTLLEPRARRWAFLREAVRATGACRARVVRARHDQYAGAPAQTVTVRAVGLPLVELAPLVAADGRLIVFGARPAATGPLEAEAGLSARGLHSYAWPRTVPRET